MEGDCGMRGDGGTEEPSSRSLPRTTGNVKSSGADAVKWASCCKKEGSDRAHVPILLVYSRGKQLLLLSSAPELELPRVINNIQ